MRPLLTLLGTVLLLVGIYAYTEFAQRVKNAAPSVILKESEGEFSATVTCTLDCTPNKPFELPALEVRLANQILLTRQDDLPRMTQFEIDRIPNVVVGRNEIIVQAHVGSANESGANANDLGCLRIQIFRDGAPIAQESFWSEPGQPILVGALMFEAASTDIAAEAP